MGALRNLDRVVAGCSGHVMQKWAGISCSLRSSLRSLDNSSVIGSPLSSFASSFGAICSSTSRSVVVGNELCSTTGMLVSRVSFLRTFMGTCIKNGREDAEGKLQSGVRMKAVVPLTDKEYKEWVARSAKKQHAFLVALPAADQWPFLEKLEASGLRPRMSLWEKALHDMHKYSSTSLEILCTRVDELWGRGYSPDAAVYTVLLFACRKEGKLQRAFELYAEMTARSVPVTETFFVALARVLSAFYGIRTKIIHVVTSEEPLLHVEAFIKAMGTSNVNMNLEIAHLLLTVVRLPCNQATRKEQTRGLELARYILEIFHNKGVRVSDRVCAAILDCYAVHREGDMNEAVGLLDEMKSFGDGVGPETYATLIKGYRLRGDFGKVDFYLRLVDVQKLNLSGSAGPNIMEAYLAQECYSEAELLFRQAEVKGQMTPYLILVHIRTLFLQHKLEEILEIIKTYVASFNWACTGRPASLVPVLLEALAHCPTEEGRGIICEALELCPSIQASICARLLRDGSIASWDAFYRVADEFKSWQTSSTHMVIQCLSDCFWGLGFRDRSVKLLAWARDNSIFPRVFRKGTNPGLHSMLTLDLHHLTVNTAKAVVLLVLKDIVEKAGGGESLWGLRLITGRRRTRGMYVEVPNILQEYGFPLRVVRPLANEGGFVVSRTDISQWLKSLR